MARSVLNLRLACWSSPNRVSVNSSSIDHFEPGSISWVRRWGKLPPGLKLYLAMIISIWALTAIALVYYHFTSSMLETQLWSPRTDNFGDFWHYYKLFASFHTQAFFESADRFAYPAPCAVLYAMLYGAGPRPHLVFDILLVLVFLASGYLFFRALQHFGVERKEAALITALLMMTTYPWHTLYDRANLELFVYVFLAGGVWAFLTDRPVLAAALWGCAGAMKIYPIALLALFLHRRTKLPLLVGLATFAGVLLLSFWYAGPTIAAAARGTVEGMTGFIGHYAASARREELNLDHSMLGALKEILSLNMFHLGEDWSRMSRVYQFAVFLGAPILFFGWIRRLPLLNELCLLLVAVVLLPPVSYDYTLVHIYLVMGIVLGAYFYAIRRGRAFPGAMVYFAAFALLTTPQTWIHLRGLRPNGVIKCLALIVIAVLLMRFPLSVGLPVENLHERGAPPD